MQISNQYKRIVYKHCTVRHLMSFIGYQYREAKHLISIHMCTHIKLRFVRMMYVYARPMMIIYSYKYHHITCKLGTVTMKSLLYSQGLILISFMWNSNSVVSYGNKYRYNNCTSPMKDWYPFIYRYIHGKKLHKRHFLRISYISTYLLFHTGDKIQNATCLFQTTPSYRS